MVKDFVASDKVFQFTAKFVELLNQADNIGFIMSNLKVNMLLQSSICQLC
jgi:hypothetical protein